MKIYQLFFKIDNRERMDDLVLARPRVFANENKALDELEKYTKVYNSFLSENTKKVKMYKTICKSLNDTYLAKAPCFLIMEHEVIE